MTRFAVVLLLVAGCGGGAPKTSTGPGVGNGETADPIPKTKGPDCAVVADRLATVAHADTPDRQAEARDKLRTRCADDKWSDEARSCFATVETDDEIDGCGKLLTDAQRAQLDLPPDLSPKGGAAAPPPESTGKLKTRGGTRGAQPRSSSDPCEGGESKSDPCEGGE
jgi:hypothetical protein